MRITWLLEDASQIWGGVKVALEDANWLQEQGHTVTVVSRSAAPSWLPLSCEFQQVSDFQAENLPDADVVIGTFWTTVPWAAAAGPEKGVPVHYCQGYEGDQKENAALRERIESAYRLPGVEHITISDNLTALLRERFGIESRQIVYAIDSSVHYPAPERAPGSPLRVGLVGPYQISWKGLPTGYDACRLAQAAGQDLVLVRATNTTPDVAEHTGDLTIEWHEQVEPSKMGDYYRSLDLFIATSVGPEEGFFLPAIEAMACGVPTVLTDIPCFRSHGSKQIGSDRDHYALFVPPNDPAAMAEAIVVAGRVPDVRARLREAGLEVASRYDKDAHGRELERALQTIIAERNAPVAVAASMPGDRPSNEPPAPAPIPALLPNDTVDPASICRAAREQLAAGEFDTALTALDTLARTGCDDEELHELRGTALHALQRYHDAAQAFRAAIAVGGRTGDAFNRLGMVLYQAGDRRGARKAFESALALDPDHGDARNNLTDLTAA